MPHLPQRHKPDTKSAQHERRTRYDATRPSASKRGYDNSWRTVRKQHLTQYPLCEECLAVGRYISATDVHHKIKLRDAPHLRDNAANLMSLCHACHSKITAKGG
jgi:5-methylcytosine-specific restriction protein A